MRSYSELPEDYTEILQIDLQKNKRLMLLVNALAIAIGVIMAVPMHFYVPIGSLFSMDKGLFAYSVRFAALVVLMIAYIVLHELVHGMAMKLCGTKKIKYGFTGMYAFAGSTDYYAKKPYIFIGLAPVVLWGVVLAVINPFVPRDWFWVVWMLQIVNISGAAGDLYVTCRFFRMPSDILVRDHGMSMKVYGRN
ncbi:MAG: DUF3267 domain-containing protein [Clostridia bacterium]|nr:DUF3267 domain-containing protein [Clostridia bacterium]